MRFLASLVILGLLISPYGAQLDKPIEDKAVLDSIIKAATKKIATNDVTDASLLRSQLNRESATFMLPPLNSIASGQQGLYAKAMAGVLVVAGIYKCTSCSNWHASCAGGFVLTADGKVATNYHVIDQPAMKTFLAMGADGQVYEIESVLAANKQTDVAIVQLKLSAGKKLTPLPLTGQIEPGETVYVLSHPDNRFYMLTKGIVSRFVRKGQTTWMCVTAEYAKGSSGCPVIDEKGQVVGMVANTESVYYINEDGKQENLQMVIRNCVPSTSILRLIR